MPNIIINIPLYFTGITISLMYIFTTLEFPTHNSDFHLLTTSINAKYYYQYTLILSIHDCLIDISTDSINSCYQKFKPATSTYPYITNWVTNVTKHKNLDDWELVVHQTKITVWKQKSLNVLYQSTFLYIPWCKWLMLCMA